MRFLLPGRPVARGVAFNLAGTALPAVLGLLAIPYLVRVLGPDRFGVLALGWTLVAYLTLLHLGVGPALTQSSAGAEATDPALAPTLWTALSLTGGAGLLAGAALFLLAAPLAGVLGVPPQLEAEAASAFRILAAAIPFTIGSQALVGMLVARSRFGQVNLVSAGVSSVSYLGPLAAAALGAGLPGIIAVLAGARVVGWLAYLAFCAAEYPQLRVPLGPQRARALALLRFGGWTTVSSVVSPLMTYMDRFVVAALVSTAAVAFYAGPQEVVLRMGMVSGAVVGVLFPAFAAARASPPRLRALLERGLSAVFGMVLPLSLAAGAFAGEALELWLGAEWAAAARGAVVFLALGLLANGLAKVAAALLQGIGRPDLTARLHLAELPLYLLLLFLLVRQYGLAGAAAAWLARAAVDAAALFWLACRVLPGAERAARRAAAMGLGGAAALALALLMQPLWLRAGWVLLVGGGVALVYGRGLLRAAPGAPLRGGQA